MAWPCITRACCINRFWSELDKADIAVPLVFTKYSDVADVRHLHPQPGPIAHSHQHPRAVAIETEPAYSAPGESTDAAPSAPPASTARGSSVTRQDFRAWRVRPEPSCKPKHEYRPSETPFDTETQYRKDYKPWPIPRRDHPWIPKAEVHSTKQDHLSSEPDTGVEKCEIEERVREKEDAREERKSPVKKEEADVAAEKKKEQRAGSRGRRSAADALNRQIKQEGSSGSSYRMEFKAYTDVKPVKPIKAKSQYKLAMEDKPNLETSYSATYKGEQAKPEATDNKLLERRRIRSLYNEPGIKEPSKVEKGNVSQSKPKKTTSHNKTASRVKAKSVSGIQPGKKKTSVSKTELNPDGGVTKKSKEIINRLAEAKD